MISSYLTDYGYKIIVAEDGNEAINKFKQHVDEIDLIILDVVMPHKNCASPAEFMGDYRFGQFPKCLI